MRLISPPSSWLQLPDGLRTGRVSPPSPLPRRLPRSPQPLPTPSAAVGRPSPTLDGQGVVQGQQAHADSLARTRLAAALFAEARSYYQSIG